MNPALFYLQAASIEVRLGNSNPWRMWRDITYNGRDIMLWKPQSVEMWIDRSISDNEFNSSGVSEESLANHLIALEGQREECIGWRGILPLMQAASMLYGLYRPPSPIGDINSLVEYTFGIQLLPPISSARLVYWIGRG